MIVFGGAALSSEGGGYGFGKVDNSIDLLYHALDLGIDHFDTAPIYGFGESERTLGQAFKNQREKVKFISKAGVTWHNSRRVNMSNEPKVVQKMLEQSLRDLQSDYIDIYMIHWPDEKVDIRFSIEVLAKAQSQGKIQSIGLCNTNQAELDLACEVAEIEYLQSEFNFFNNGFRDLNTDSTKTMGWGTFDKGILAGTVTRERSFEKSDCRSWAPWWKKSGWRKKVDIVESFEFRELILPLSIHYSLENMDFTLVGAKTSDQLEQLIQARDEKVDPQCLIAAIEFFQENCP